MSDVKTAAIKSLVSKITNNPKSWWSGDSRVEQFMTGVNEALDRSGLDRDKRTDVYNRAYEAVYYAIKEYADGKAHK